MTQHEAQATPDVIIGMLSVIGYLARVLLDPGATHSFIANSFVLYASVKPTPINGEFSIALPTRNVLFANRVFRGSFVQVGDAPQRNDMDLLGTFLFKMPNFSTKETTCASFLTRLPICTFWGCVSL